MNIILASASPRRRELLSSMGWHFSVEPSYITEKTVPGESAEEMVCRLALSKADNIFSRRGGSWVVGADTVVSADGVIYGKPRNDDAALDMLMNLQGKTHSVITGVALIAPDGRKKSAFEKTTVTFRAMTREELSAYVASGESLDKAGAYAIQDKGALLVEKINGCYFNVVGLPIQLLSKMFSDMGWPLSEQWGK